MNEQQEWWREQTYQAMDAFLVEGETMRPIWRLNEDRHLFMDKMEAIVAHATALGRQAALKEAEEAVEAMREKGRCQFFDPQKGTLCGACLGCSRIAQGRWIDVVKVALRALGKQD